MARVLTYSDCIFEIAAWLRRCGVEVHLYARELPCSGMYRSETRQIFLNEPNALVALCTIAHEAGHWLGYLIDEKSHSYQRERQAFAYGWHVLRWFDAPVTRATWILFDQGRREAPDVETRHLFRAG